MGMVLLVRHGQASFGAEDYDVLSETGIAQSRRLGCWLAEAGIEPDALVHGAMRRQRDTATAMAEAAGLVGGARARRGLERVRPPRCRRARPRGLGGLDRADRRPGPALFQQAFVEATARWSGGEHDDEYDESWPAFVDRVTGALERACARDGVTVVVSSGGPIAVACAVLVDPEATATELPRLWNAFNTVCANTGVTRVITGSTGRRMLTFNEHAHLPRDQVTYR